MKNLIYFSVLLFSLLPLVVAASTKEQYSFPVLWRLARENEPELRAASQDFEAARIYEQRLERHWYPRLFLDARAYFTNDPVLSFMSVMGQRQITSSDFLPQSLNWPGHNVFERGTLGLDFPLYEGGAKVVAARASVKMTEAKFLELRSTEIAQYAELANAYSSILSLLAQKTELQKLDDNLREVVTKYTVGSKSNPVGYSGLLGLKNLRNRLSGILIENVAKTVSLQEKIRIKTKSIPEKWHPLSQDVKDFMKEYLSVKSENDAPASVRAMHVAAESAEIAKDMEKAKFLPRMGLFATGDLYAGKRATNASATGGVYFQWDLFSAPNIGAISQAEHAAASAAARADAFDDNTRTARTDSEQTKNSLEKNLSLMEESSKLLAEQSAMAEVLFRNGSINALQLTEVLARRTDLIIARTNAELALAQVRSNLLVQTNASGVPYEN